MFLCFSSASLQGLSAGAPSGHGCFGAEFSIVVSRRLTASFGQTNSVDTRRLTIDRIGMEPLVRCSAFTRSSTDSSQRYSAPPQRHHRRAPHRHVDVATRIAKTDGFNISVGSTDSGDTTHEVGAPPGVLAQLGVFSGGLVLIESAPAAPKLLGTLVDAAEMKAKKASATASHQTIRRLVRVRSHRRRRPNAVPARTVGNGGRSHRAQTSRVEVPPMLAFNLRLHYEGFEARTVRLLPCLELSTPPVPTQATQHQQRDGQEEGQAGKPGLRNDDNCDGCYPVRFRCREVGVRRLLHGKVSAFTRCAGAVRRHFAQPRLLHEGDLFCVRVTPPPEEHGRRHSNWSAQLVRGSRSTVNDTDSDSDTDDDYTNTDDDDDDDDDDVDDLADVLGDESHGDGDDGGAVHAAVRKRRSLGRQLARLKAKFARPAEQLVFFQVVRVVLNDVESSSHTPTTDTLATPGSVHSMPNLGWCSTEWTQLHEDGCVTRRGPPTPCERDLWRVYHSAAPALLPTSALHRSTTPAGEASEGGGGGGGDGGGDEETAPPAPRSSNRSRSSSALLLMWKQQAQKYPVRPRRTFSAMVAQLKRLLRPAFDPQFAHLRRPAPVLLCGVSVCVHPCVCGWATD